MKAIVFSMNMDDGERVWKRRTETTMAFLIYGSGDGSYEYKLDCKKNLSNSPRPNKGKPSIKAKISKQKLHIWIMQCKRAMNKSQIMIGKAEERRRE